MAAAGNKRSRFRLKRVRFCYLPGIYRGAASVRNQIQSTEVSTRYAKNRKAQDQGHACGTLYLRIRPFVRAVLANQDSHPVDLLSIGSRGPATLSASELVSPGSRLLLQITHFQVKRGDSDPIPDSWFRAVIPELKHTLDKRPGTVRLD